MADKNKNLESEAAILERIEQQEQRGEKREEREEKKAETPVDSKQAVEEKIVDMKNVLSKKVSKITDLYNMSMQTNKVLQQARTALGITSDDSTNIQQELEDEFRHAEGVKDKLKVLVKFKAALMEQMDEFLEDLKAKMLEEVKDEWATKLHLWYQGKVEGREQLLTDSTGFVEIWSGAGEDMQGQAFERFKAGEGQRVILDTHYGLFKEKIEAEAERMAVNKYNDEVGEGLLDRLTEKIQQYASKTI